MISKQKIRRDRLARLVESGRCQSTEAPDYANQLKQIAGKAANTEAINKESKFFKALADETRLKILKILEVQEMCVCEVMVALNLTQPTASHHLGLLENAGLVNARKEGKWVFYSVVDRKLIENMRALGIL
jgi:DNA-binding transcriptional ArsR family regulator